MARAIWHGTLTLGGIHLPIALHSNRKRREFDFRLIDRRDHSPITTIRVNQRTGESVTPQEIVRSYRLSDGNYVAVPEEEFKKATPEFTRAVRIIAFVDRDAVSPVYFEKPYFIEPGPQGEEGYALLLYVLATTGKIAVARTVLHHRERIAALVPEGALLSLVAMRYAAELRHPRRLGRPAPTPKSAGLAPREIELARRLVERMSAPWRPLNYHDEYRERVLDYVRRRTSGAGGEKPARVPVEELRPTPRGNLLKELERSLSGEEQATPKRRSKTA